MSGNPNLLQYACTCTGWTCIIVGFQCPHRPLRFAEFVVLQGSLAMSCLPRAPC